MSAASLVNLARLNVRSIDAMLLRSWLHHPNAEVRAIAAAETARRDRLVTDWTGTADYYAIVRRGL